MRRRSAPSIDDIRIVRGLAAPGAAATTFGRTVFVRRGVTMGPRLRRHEYEHVLQFYELGRVRFLVRYLGEYLRWRLRGHGHRSAYRRISFEVRAEWRARRALGIGVVEPRTAHAAAGSGEAAATVSIRPAVAEDRGFLARMLAVAADWRPGTVPRSVDEVLADPSLAHYLVGWPRPGDAGVVAEDERGRAIGAAWYRAFTAEDPGFGFVAVDVPELAIGVVEGTRRRGVGQGLLLALVDVARRSGVHRLSLSVEVDNPARRLYERLGFEVVAEADGAATMTLEVG